MIAEGATAVLLVFAALFPIVNPLGMAPIFATMTADATPDTRRVLARAVATNGFVLLLVSFFAGSYVLAFFGLQVPAVQVAGGLIVTASGWRLLTQETLDAARRATAEREADRAVLGRAFYPLTMPLTVGPGSIAVAVTLGTDSRATRAPLRIELAQDLGAIIGIALVAGTILVSFRSANRLGALLGETGMSVFMRLSAFILVCIGIQITWNGVSGLLASVTSAT
ncbi:MAG TPA: MarC family protein [Thermodesulfobacteriota bacterium]